MGFQTVYINTGFIEPVVFDTSLKEDLVQANTYRYT